MAKKDNTFYWISSTTSSPTQLEILNKSLAEFYSQPKNRAAYQGMLDKIDDMPQKGEFSYLILEYLLKSNAETILEVGCANGRIFGQLSIMGYKGKYIGTEVAPYIIQKNQEKYPTAEWKVAGAYQLPVEDESLDICFSFFVLEHLVYPEKALNEMLRTLKKGGKMVLVFPDFVESGRLPSQLLGYRPILTAKEKLQKGYLLDAALSLYDSRVRLPKALKEIHTTVGSFPLNANLVCVNYPDLMSHDIDAVYIASKKEIKQWAEAKGLSVEFPYGTQGELNEKAFMTLCK